MIKVKSAEMRKSDNRLVLSMR